MADLRRQRGIQSELLAADFLQARGLKVLARNFRCKTGELDLVCLDHEVLAIIEVRQRGTQRFGGALQSITWCKQRKIIRATRYLLQRHAALQGRVVRFDVVAVQGLPGAQRLVWVKDAFRAT